MYRKILVGSDGSVTASSAVDRAVEVARLSGASLTIASAGWPAKSERVVAAEAERHADAGISIDTLVIDTDPVSALIDTAETGSYDLLVVGNKGMTGAKRFLPIGSVPNKVVHHLPCTMLIVQTT